MSRVTKRPDQRRAEFIRTAKSIFNEKGFENTSVDDIVNRMKVAKGLFYYYFDTKEDIFNLILDDYMDENQKIIHRIMEKTDLSTLERFREWLLASKELKLREKALTLYIHEEANKDLHARIERRGIKIMHPMMQQIVEQGVREGLFNVDYPKDAALALLGIMSYVGHQPVDRKDNSAVAERLDVIQYLSEKLLGARPGTLSLFWELVPKEVTRARRNRSERKRRGGFLDDASGKEERGKGARRGEGRKQG